LGDASRVTLRLRLLILNDRLLAVLLAILLIGTTLAFGGVVWWARLALASWALLFLVAWVVRAFLEGTWRVLKSPLVPLGVLGVMLAVAQLVPLPATMAERISPRSRAVYAQGLSPNRAEVEAKGLDLPEPAGGRSPVTVDRAATLRWLTSAIIGLGVFWGVGQFVDRPARLLVIWGCIIAAFSLNTALGVVQWLGRANGLYGFVEPGTGGAWTPSLDDLAAMPNATALRFLVPPREASAHPAWAVARPDRPFLLGTMMGGPGAYLALGSLGLPLTLGLVLQILAPRGSREPLGARLRDSGTTGLVVLLGSLMLIGAGLIGLLAGPLLSVPFALGLLVVGLPGAWPSGLRWTAVGLTLVALIALAIGVILGETCVERLEGVSPWSSRATWASARRVWIDAARIVGDFPILGAGLGSFATVYPYYKSGDASHTTALSSLLQWLVETGMAGAVLLAVGGLWCLVRLPSAIRRVGTADRPLAFGLVGTLVCFSLFSVLHWTVALAAVAFAPRALGGICDRWLAGGTDFFAEGA
jgi:hypothetical protein